MAVRETDIKNQIKDYLALKGIFSFPFTQGLGSKRGLPDRVIHYKGRVIYLEVKTPKGKLSEHQKGFGMQCRQDGIPYWVVSSLERLEELLGIYVS